MPLVLDREMEDFSLLDGAAGGFIRRGHHEIGERAPLKFRRALQADQNLVRQTGFQAGAVVWGADFITSAYGNLPY